MSKHTPGPWRHAEGIAGFGLISGPDEHAICHINSHDTSVSNETMLANASLIAAAPELLEVSKMFVELAKLNVDFSQFLELGPIYLKACQAIDKAEGK